MQVLSLLKKYNIPLKYDLGAEIGYGADGQVFELLEDNNRVIKLSILYNYSDQDIDDCYDQIVKTLSYIQEHRPDPCVRVYEHGCLYRGQRDTYIGTQDFIIYYYVMEKLNKISEDEKKVFHSIISHEDLGIKKNFSESVLKDMLVGMGRGLDFDMEKVLLFDNNIRNSKVRHNDIHIRNIMKTGAGDFRLIDFDRVKIGG